MSEMEKREEISRYDSMSTEELQEILCKHAHNELDTEPETDELFEIMEVLSVRRQQQEPQVFRSDEEALADFRKHYMPKAKREGRAKAIRFHNRAGYAFLPRLRSRLTQGRSALPWNPWIFGQEDSHLFLATHSGILSS